MVGLSEHEHGTDADWLVSLRLSRKSRSARLSAAARWMPERISNLNLVVAGDGGLCMVCAFRRAFRSGGMLVEIAVVVALFGAIAFWRNDTRPSGFGQRLPHPLHGHRIPYRQ